MHGSPRIAALEFWPVDVPLEEPFGIATGTQLVANNVFVRLTLEDGTTGLGEAAPFPAVNGETQSDVLATLPSAAEALRGLSAERYRMVADAAREALLLVPSARAAVEMALFDALCRRAHISLWAFFGGAEAELTTDITIPTGTPEAARDAARRARVAGFTLLKVKVGGVSLDVDVARVLAVAEAASDAELLLDANASLTAEHAIELVRAIGPTRDKIVLFEQPTAASDLQALGRVRAEARIPVAADESARSRSAVAELAKAGVVDAINIKTMKTGIVEALDMMAVARAHGLGLMVGGMVETELSMTTSACLAAGTGGFRFVDLDTPLFMGRRPLSGGFEQTGSRLRVDGIAEGHGVRFLGGL